MSEPKDLEATYRRYAGDRATRDRWSAANPGNRAIHDERNAALEAALGTLVARTSRARAVEVGCGTGVLLAELAAMPALATASVVGVELLGFRLDAARARSRDAALVNADGRRLPFPSASIDVVVLATVLSSLTAEGMAAGVAREIDRVLRPGGGVAWYDMRLPNPANRALRPVGRRRIERLFPGYRVQVHSVTLLPQLARRLGRRTTRWYPRLAAQPWLRSHLVGALHKPT